MGSLRHPKGHARCGLFKYMYKRLLVALNKYIYLLPFFQYCASPLPVPPPRPTPGTGGCPLSPTK